MDFDQVYPKRVTLGEDGIYRWSVDVNLKTDHYSQRLFMKCMYIITGSVFALMLLVMLFQQDFSLVWVPVLCCGSVLLIGVASFRIYRAFIHDQCTVGYEMSGEGIALIRSPAEQKLMKAFGIISVAAGMAAGKTLEGIGRGAACDAAAAPARTVFRRVRSLREYPETHMITLKTLVLSNTVWIPAEDYDTVLSFLRSHTEEAVRQHPDRGILKRIGMASALSAGLNTVIAVINAVSFSSTKRLPISVAGTSGAYVTQNAFAMRVIFPADGADIEAPWWANQLEMDSGNALAGFLLVALVFFLLLSLIHVFRSGSEHPYE